MTSLKLCCDAKRLKLAASILATHATLTMQKALLRYLNLPKVQREFCQRATNQQKDNGRAFFKFPTFSQRISFFYLTLARRNSLLEMYRWEWNRVYLKI